MQVIVSVQLEDKEKLDADPDSIAGKVLRAVGGTKERDLVTVHVQTITTGQAGNVPLPPEDE